MAHNETLDYQCKNDADLYVYSGRSGRINKGESLLSFLSNGWPMGLVLGLFLFIEFLT